MDSPVAATSRTCSTGVARMKKPASAAPDSTRSMRVVQALRVVEAAQMGDVVLGHVEGAVQDDRLEHGRVEPAVGLGHAGERVVGDRLVLQGEAERALEEAVHVAERHPVVSGRRLELAWIVELLDVEVPPGDVANRDLLVGVLLEAGEQAVGGEDRGARGPPAPRAA